LESNGNGVVGNKENGFDEPRAKGNEGKVGFVSTVKGGER